MESINGIFDKVLETEDLIADVEQLLASFIDLEDKLFKRRAAKVLKIYNEMNLNQIQREMFTGDWRTIFPRRFRITF